MNDTNNDRNQNTPATTIKKSILNEFVNNVNLLWLPPSSSSIPILSNPPTSLEFVRDYVSLSRPCIIRNALVLDHNDHDDDHGHPNETNVSKNPSKTTITLDQLIEKYPNIEITVDITPDGHGDCIRQVKTFVHDDDDDNQTSSQQLVFVKPMEKKMKLIEFANHLRSRRQSSLSLDNDDVKNRGCHDDDGNNQQSHQNRIHRHDCNWKTRSFDAKVIRNNKNNNKNNMNNEIENNINHRPCHDHDSSHTIQHTDNENNNDNDDESDNNDDDKSLLLPINDTIYYYSHQNDCLRIEWDDTFWKNNEWDIPKSFQWAEDAFCYNNDSSGPDAINIWIGNEYVTSSLHKDYYENLFYVCNGIKIFTIYPPCDTLFLHEYIYPLGEFYYCNKSKQWEVIIKEKQEEQEETTSTTQERQESDNNDTASSKYETIRWIDNYQDEDDKNVDDNDNDTNRNYYKKHGITIHVHAGEMLYLPALWYHQVTQSCETIAINYWYDMNFNSPLYCYYSLLQRLSSLKKSS